jgi:hypothetical protein
MQKANDAYWSAGLAKLKLELKRDQATIRMTKLGSKALADLFEWLDLKCKIGMQQEAKLLGTAFMDHFFPVLKAEGWESTAGNFAAVRAAPIPLPEGAPQIKEKGTHFLIVRANFNVPNSRDNMKMGALTACMATIAKLAGAKNTIFAITLASRAKEDNTKTDVLDGYRLLMETSDCFA